MTKNDMGRIESTKKAADAACAYEAAVIAADRAVALGATLRKAQGRIPLDLLDRIAWAQMRAAHTGIVAHRLKCAVACPRRGDTRGESL